MKRFSIAFYLTGILSICLGVANATAAVVFEVPDTEIGVGERFGVNIIYTGLSADDELLAFGFDVNSPAGLSFLGANIGAPFSDDSLLLPDTDVAGSAFPGLPGGDDIILARLNFEAVSAGTRLIGIVSDLGDPNEGLFTLLDPQIDLTSSVTINVVPVPGSLLLFGSGLFGLFRLRKTFNAKVAR
jgi:hypothetical protein